MGILDRALRLGEAKQYKGYAQRVERINAYEPEMELLTDEELRGEAEKLRERARGGETLDDLLDDSFARTREASKRALGLRHFDVQMIGGMVLHDGAIAEMKTGEGKTLTATLPIVLNSLGGTGVHLVTVKDYLARRRPPPPRRRVDEADLRRARGHRGDPAEHAALRGEAGRLRRGRNVRHELG